MSRAANAPIAISCGEPAGVGPEVAAKAFAARDGVGRMRHIDLTILWLQQASRELGLVIYKVPGEYNRANIGTKKLSAPQLERESRMTGLIDILELSDEPVPEASAVTEDNYGAIDRNVLELASALAKVLGERSGVGHAAKTSCPRGGVGPSL